jgi:hypothetical protein
VSIRKKSGPIKTFCHLFLLTGFFGIASAQVPDVDSMIHKYPFIRKELSVLHNDSLSLASFYAKLHDLENGKRSRVNVVHIGDSHIQADAMSGTVRQLLQKDFGNAGRGFVFPYRVAHSNEPTSYKSFSNVKWESKRNVFPDQPLPIGLGGFTIETRDSGATLSLLVKDQGKLNYGFTRFTLFHEKGTGNFNYAVCDDFNCRVGKIDSRNISTSKYASVQEFETPMHQLMISCTGDGDSAGCSRIYGMLLENGKPGLLYDMIGVNGAEFRHYNQSLHFQEQLSYLQPDLVIVSMGTNEAFGAHFNAEEFSRNIDTLVSGIRIRNPGAEILLTTPGDSFRKSRKGRVKNPDMKLARDAVITYAESHGCAWWDLYEIMGGYGSMAKWFAAHISAKDRVHFSGTGYVMQGGMLYEAISKSFEKYKSDKGQ